MDAVPCIKCGETGGVRVDVADGDTITCGGCDQEYTAADVEAVLDAWRPVLTWLTRHPAKEGSAPNPYVPPADPLTARLTAGRGKPE